MRPDTSSIFFRWNRNSSLSVLHSVNKRFSCWKWQSCQILHVYWVFVFWNAFARIIFQIGMVKMWIRNSELGTYQAMAISSNHLHPMCANAKTIVRKRTAVQFQFGIYFAVQSKIESFRIIWAFVYCFWKKFHAGKSSRNTPFYNESGMWSWIQNLSKMQVMSVFKSIEKE